ncbi:hypothetical protein [Hymenobacter chitinivorans]|uniref:Uncharacterized protein n=1 Tax=Hymenobacter chitinivorans DSM 11115 TaxID=1121954 RepID=A0A2M9BAR0_9BACT|nr:hypothetical protein [Hymenobacter chitinivorans]PJJ55024.1 hypothetical protein CLV45_3373 [Hymenobacter chitinivorans DSM 11115]
MMLASTAPLQWPSAGRSLGILVAVSAVLWLWLQLPDWYRAGHSATETGQWLTALVYNDWTALALMLAANALVARYATGPMWRLGHSIELQGMRGAFVFVLSLLFHLVVSGCGLAVLVLGSGWLETGA